MRAKLFEGSDPPVCVLCGEQIYRGAGIDNWIHSRTKLMDCFPPQLAPAIDITSGWITVDEAGRILGWPTEGVMNWFVDKIILVDRREHRILLWDVLRAVTTKLETVVERLNKMDQHLSDLNAACANMESK